jgi:hypothetical protein
LLTRVPLASGAAAFGSVMAIRRPLLIEFMISSALPKRFFPSATTVRAKSQLKGHTDGA